MAVPEEVPVFLGSVSCGGSGDNDHCCLERQEHREAPLRTPAGCSNPSLLARTVVMAEEFPERLQEKLPGKERGSFVETDKHQSLLVSENGGYCLWGRKTPKGSHNGPHSPSGSSKADVSQGHPGAEVSGSSPFISGSGR